MHLLPCRINWYPGSCDNYKSESLEIHVSCRQIDPKYRPSEARLFITGNKLLNFALTIRICSVNIKNLIPLFINADCNSDISTLHELQIFGIWYSEWTKVDNTWSFSVPAMLSEKLPCFLFNIYHGTNTRIMQGDETSTEKNASSQKWIQRIWTKCAWTCISNINRWRDFSYIDTVLHIIIFI